MREVDDQLWRLPFAKNAWPSQLYHQTDPDLILPPAIQGAGAALGYQVQIWKNQGEELRTWLLDTPTSSDFWQIINAHKLMQRLNEARVDPDSKKVIKGLMCVCAIRLALTEPLKAAQQRRSRSD